MRQVRIWVHPEFKKKMKKEAIEQETTILQLSENLAKDMNPIKQIQRKHAKRFGFKI